MVKITIELLNNLGPLHDRQLVYHIQQKIIAYLQVSILTQDQLGLMYLRRHIQAHLKYIGKIHINIRVLVGDL